MRDWNTRRSSHDEQAVPLVMAVFREHGFAEFTQGAETDPQAGRDALRGLNDRTAIVLRYRPDKVVVRPRHGALYCEIKGTPEDRPNFAVEAKAFWAMRQHVQSGHRVLLGFALLPGGPVYCAWAQDIPLPMRINIPRREDYKEGLAWVRENFPGSFPQLTEYRSGSGTPYFLIPKTEPFLIPAAEFIAQNFGE